MTNELIEKIESIRRLVAPNPSAHFRPGADLAIENICDILEAIVGRDTKPETKPAGTIKANSNDEIIEIRTMDQWGATICAHRINLPAAKTKPDSDSEAHRLIMDLHAVPLMLGVGNRMREYYDRHKTKG